MVGYWPRFWRRLWADSTPWARDNIGLAVVMLIVPPIAVYLHDPTHEIDWDVMRTALWLYLAAFIAYATICAVKTVLKLDRELGSRCDSLQQRLEALEANIPNIELKIADFAVHFASRDEPHRRDIFVCAEIRLHNSPTQNVEYSMLLVRKGRPHKSAWVRDVDNWRVVDRRHYKHLGDGLRPYFFVDAHPLTEILEPTRKYEGWVHFTTSGLTDSEISESVMRLEAVAKHGVGFDEMKMPSLLVTTENLVEKKAIPRPQ